MTAHRPIEKDCCAGGTGLMPPETALARAIRLKAEELPVTQVPLMTARGMVLAAPVLAAADGPPFDACAMDGYAVTTTALAGAGPWTLPVSGNVAAGDAPGRHSTRARELPSKNTRKSMESHSKQQGQFPMKS